MKLAIIYVAIGFCASTSTTNCNAQNQPSNGQSSQAVISIERASFASRLQGDYELSSYLKKVEDSEGKIFYEAGLFSDGPDELPLEAGEYIFFIGCKSRNVSNYHTVRSQIKPGERYTAYCIGRYKDSIFGEKIVGMLALISDERNLEMERRENQERFVGTEFKAGKLK